MFRRWNFTVFSEIPSWAAISLLRWPATTRRSTSVSRSVSRSGAEVAAGRANSAMIRAAVAGEIAASPRSTASIIARSWSASRFLSR